MRPTKPATRPRRIDILLVRTVFINLIMARVALGLMLNRRRNRDVPLRAWPTARPAPFVDIIIPARNEERNIGPLVESLMQQRYPADRWRVSVVNDG